MSKSPFLALVGLLLVSPSYAQQNQAQWEFDFAPYFWLGDSSGDQTVRGINATVDLDFFDDVADNLDKGFQFHFEAKKDRWSFIFDPTLLEIVTSQNTGAAAFETRAKSVVIDMKVAYEFIGPLELLAGLRYYESDLDINLASPAIQVSQDEDWWDAVVGVRYRWSAGERWSFLAEGDVGGFDFGSSSDIAWNLSLVATWSFGPNYDLAFGYRILDIDYDRGSGLNGFRYNIQTNGPLIGVNFNF